ncbi:MAG: hypothetical protein QM537_02740 [Candidatus Symbiobacter sp.]|nr:hypothetical protein [Candidatus Symbiobacter sp.]
MKDKIVMTVSDVTAALTKKGFRKPREDRPDLEYNSKALGRNITLQFRYPSPLNQGSKAIIARKLSISVAFFEDMVSCYKDHAAYETELGKNYNM